MGQRHQIYFAIKKDNEYECISAYHHQWCYGLRATANVYRMRNALLKALDARSLGKNNKWSPFSFSDSRQIYPLIASVYGIDLDGANSMVHDETDSGYLIDFNENKFTPGNGDNNDGCTMFLIDFDKQEIRACFFAIHGVEGDYPNTLENYKPWTVTQYLSLYYSSQDLEEEGMEREKIIIFNSAPIKKITVSEFNKLCEKAV